MDIRKFFGGAPSTKTSNNSNNLAPKNSSSKSKSPQKKSKASKTSPLKVSIKNKPSVLTLSPKAKVDINRTSKRVAPEVLDSENEDFLKISTKLEAKKKMKEKEKPENVDNRKHEEVKEAKHTEKSVMTADNDDSFNNNSSEKKSKPAARQKLKRENAHSEESSEEDEAPIVKRKPSSKSNKKAVIYDSESDEDPLPKNLRAKSPNPRSSKKHNVDHDLAENFIRDAFSKVMPKSVKTTASVKPNVTPDVVKQPVNVNEFFGVTPIQRTESRQPLAKLEKEAIPASQDVEMPAKKIKLDETSSEFKIAGIRLSEKLAAKRKVAEELQSKKAVHLNLEEKPSKLPEVQKRAEAVSKSPQKPSTENLTPRPALAAATPKSSKTTSPDVVVGSAEKGQLQKKGSSFFAFKNREPPKALGQREIPQGAENCLEGLTFVVTGVLESIERDDVKSLLERHGGKLMQNVSKNTKYVVVGRDAGEAKLSKAAQLKIKQLDEDGLFDLIRTLPSKRSKYEVAAEKEESLKKTPLRAKPSFTPSSSASVASTSARKDHGTPWPAMDRMEAVEPSRVSPDAKPDENDAALMWVDRYKPTNSKQIIGQQGDKSNAKKLLKWLTSWHKHLGKKPVDGRSNDDGAGHRAALLSGPPGVGKTTTAQVVCKEAGFSYVELNASDTRSKRSLKEEVADALKNHTVVDFFSQVSSGSKSGGGQRHCLIMEEVDGMAGNEDRGGMQELMQLIKSTKIPIICICNDRNNPKVRSLSFHCFDLRFQRPRIEQIKGAMMSIAFKEGLKLPPPALNDIILAANQDIRQVLHNLSMWTAKDKTLTYDQLKQEANKAQKDLHLGPFDVCRKVFVGGEETSKMTVNDKSDLFFHDYSIGPLFVQENYIHVNPYAAQGSVQNHLRCLSRAADSIASGDRVDAYVRRGGHWGLLPTQAIFASVIPGDAMRGSIGRMIDFPSWLGKNSTTSKNDRLHQELRTHMRLNIAADKRALSQDYLPALKTMLTLPLIKDGNDGVDTVVSFLDAYDLIREDFDSIIELTSWTGSKNPMSQVDSKVKAAFTRTYNKQVHMIPYATGADGKGKKRGGGGGGGDAPEDYELDLAADDGDGGAAAAAAEENSLSDNDISVDTMIKAKKAASKKAKSSQSSSNDLAEENGKGGKGKGKGSGKAKGSTKESKK